MESAFSKFKRSLEAKRASLKYEGIPFSVVLSKGKQGDKDALFFTILKYIDKQLPKAFFRYFVSRNKGTGKDELAESSHIIFNGYLLNLYEMNKSSKGPLFAFNPKIFTEADDEFLFNKLGFYFYRYFEAFIDRYLTKKNPVRDHEISGTDMDTPNDDFDGKSYMDNVADTKVESDPLEGKEDFVGYLEMIKPLYAKIVELLAKNYGVKEVAEELNISNEKTIYFYILEIKKLYATYKDILSKRSDYNASRNILIRKENS